MRVSLEDLTYYEILHGFFALMFVVIALIIGFKILLKAFHVKRKEYITFGLALIFISSAWWSVSLSYLLIIFFSYTIEAVLYVILANMFEPVALLCWLYSFCTLSYPHMKRIILSIYLIICILYEIFFSIFLFIDLKLIATQVSVFYSQRTFFTISIHILAIMTTLITGILFTKEFFKSSDLKIKWKGRFLLFAFIFLTIGAFFDAAIPRTPILLVIVRSILILSMIGFYLGFLGKIESIEEIQDKSIQENANVLEFLKIIAKHKKNPLTENEITFYKERKICLVCKTKTLRVTYICPDCDAIYCMTCANALSDLENACWVCKSPFDPSKPVHPIEFKDEDLIVETDETQKKPDKNIIKK